MRRDRESDIGTRIDKRMTKTDRAEEFCTPTDKLSLCSEREGRDCHQRRKADKLTLVSIEMREKKSFTANEQKDERVRKSITKNECGGMSINFISSAPMAINLEGRRRSENVCFFIRSTHKTNFKTFFIAVRS